MIPAKFNFPTRRNADYQEELQFTDTGVACDLTGLILKLQARSYARSPDVLFTLNMVSSNVEGLRVFNAVEGSFNITIDRSTLNDAYIAMPVFADGNNVINLVYDLTVEFPDGRREVWIEGIITINPGITTDG